MHPCVSSGGIFVEVGWGISWFNLGNQKKKYKRYVNLKEKRDADFMFLLPLLNGGTKSMVGYKIAVFKVQICHW